MFRVQNLSLEHLNIGLNLIFSRGVECRDTDEGAVCGLCPSGYDGNGKMCDVRRNICADQPCDEGLQCIQSDVSPFFRCKSCSPGFTSGDSVNCVDIDECYGLEPCDPKVRCTNLSPGFRCEACPNGYSGQHSQGLFLTAISDPNFQRQRCNDINECQEGISQCGMNSQCINTEGSYTCTCFAGFVKSNSSNDCVQIPGMCPDGITICDKNAICRNLGGRRFGCKCKVGFAGDGFVCGGDRDLDGWPDVDLGCDHHSCRQDNCPSIPVRKRQDVE